MSEPEVEVKERPQGKLFLKRTIGSWSAGTQVWFDKVLYDDTILVQVLAGSKPWLEVDVSDILRRRPRSL